MEAVYSYLFHDQWSIQYLLSELTAVDCQGSQIDAVKLACCVDDSLLYEVKG